MARQHKELHLRLVDAKNLRRYAQSTTSKHQALEDGLSKAKGRSKHWEWKAKEGIKRVAKAKKERDEAKAEAQVAQLTVVAVGDAKIRAEEELARVRDALATTEEARYKAEAEVEAARLEVERISLLLEIEAAKNEVSSLQSQVDKDKATLEEDYQKALDLIFTFGHKCCILKQNIYGDQLEVPYGMPNSSYPLPPEFFMNPRCPPTQAPTEATTT